MKGEEYQVTFSMLEIYNEQVRDLLNPKSNVKGGLKVRQKPGKGFYGRFYSINFMLVITLLASRIKLLVLFLK